MNNIFQQIHEAVQAGRRVVLATVVDKKGHGPATPGARMLVFENEETMGTVGGGALENAARNTAKSLFREGGTRLVRYNLDDNDKLVDTEETGMVCGGTSSIFFELLGDSPHLILLGAGHVGQAILQHAELLDFRITVADSRKALLETIKKHKIAYLPDYRDGYEALSVTNRSFIVIATHSHAFDAIAMENIYKMDRQPAYVGVLASRKKAETMVKQLKKNHPNADLSTLHMPVGLNIGGPTPREIAISILAEIQAVRYGKNSQNHMGKSW